jgi:hypothetical protein
MLINTEVQRIPSENRRNASKYVNVTQTLEYRKEPFLRLHVQIKIEEAISNVSV